MRQEGLGYAQNGYNSLELMPKTGRIQDLDFGYSPGFKIAIGLNLREDGWDVYAQYTRSYEKASRGLSTNQIGSLHPTWFVLDEFDQDTILLNAHAKWRIHFNVVDLEIGRNFFVSKYLALRPFTGLKTSWQTQRYKVFYTKENDTTAHVKVYDNDWGVGSRFGLNTSWFFNPHWSIYGNGAASLVWGQFTILRKDYLKKYDHEFYHRVLNQINDIHTIKGVMELGLGLRYENWTYDYRYRLRFELGWEQQVWISHNQFIRTFEESAHGDLILQGVTFKARFDF
jgi:hypothetical protein